MGKEILSVLCPNCGAPAKFDIVHQIYRCSHCGGKVKIEDARQKKLEFQKAQNEKLKESAKNFEMSTASCSGCGATLVFEKNEAISNCTFCGRSLVREDYVYDSRMPQNVIPFAVTKDEAAKLLTKWCEQNKNKSEAKHLLNKIPKLKGYYLPYKMVRGPVHCTVNKTGETLKFRADGYLNDEFINYSSQLNNLLLNCMEPFNTDDLKEFDFSYVAGQRIKIPDISEEEAQNRLNYETAENYRSNMEKIWGTKTIQINAQVDPVIKIPVLLPVYYITEGNVQAAVNGQTGKVSVLAEKDLKYFSIPWWVKGFSILVLVSGILYSIIMSAEDLTFHDALTLTGIVGLIFLIVFTAMFDDGNNGFSITKYRNIFSTGDQTYKREHGRLVLREDIIKRKIEKTIFRQKLDGKEQIVTYVFRSFKRTASMLIMSIVVIFFPVIIALFVNGFNFERLYIGGSVIWFIITVPTVPIVFIRFGFQWLYDYPWIYTISKNGKKKRYREKIKIKQKEILKYVLYALFKYPVCLATWFGIIIFIMMIYFTAFGV